MIGGLIISFLAGASLVYLVMESIRQAGGEKVKRIQMEIMKQEYCQCWESITQEECPEDILNQYAGYNEFREGLKNIKKAVKKYQL